MKLRIIFLTCLFPLILNAQSVLTLDDCIRIAKEQSPETKLAQNKFLDAWYQYKLYKKSYLPTLSLSGTIPAFNPHYSSREEFCVSFRCGKFSSHHSPIL